MHVSDQVICPMQANPSSLAALHEARVMEADSAIIGHSADIPDKDADAQVISMLMLLQVIRPPKPSSALHQGCRWDAS